MQPPEVLVPQPRRSANGDVAGRVVGVLLFLPAVVLTVVTLVVPTFDLVGAATRDVTVFTGQDGEDVGFDNFGVVTGDLGFWSTVGFSVSLVLLPLLVAAVVAPLLAAALDWAGGWARVTARVVLSLAIVVFSPIALAIAWRWSLRGEPEFGDPDLIGGALRSSTLMMTFGLVCALGLMVFLPAFRARRKLWPTLCTLAGLVVLGGLAAGLQQFTVPFVVTGFGPRNDTMTPIGLMYRAAFADGRLGLGAAAATLLLVLLAVLGVAAVLLVVLTRLRVSVEPWRSPRGRTPANAGAIVVALVALLAVVVAAVLTQVPWFEALGGQDPELPSDAESRTWVPALLSALLAVGVAYLGALGVSGLRPLGRFSEWLLLPLAPWLFVGAAPLGIEFYLSARNVGDLGEGTPFPPIMVSLVSLLVLAVVCRGHAERRGRRMAAGASSAGSFFRTVLLPTLPVAVLLVVVATFLTAQDMFWGLLTVRTPGDGPVPVLLYMATTNYGQAAFSVASATPVVAVVLGFVAVAAVQALHLDRLSATVGRPDDPTGPILVPVTGTGAYPGVPMAPGPSPRAQPTDGGTDGGTAGEPGR